MSSSPTRSWTRTGLPASSCMTTISLPLSSAWPWRPVTRRCRACCPTMPASWVHSWNSRQGSSSSATRLLWPPARDGRASSPPPPSAWHRHDCDPPQAVGCHQHASPTSRITQPGIRNRPLANPRRLGIYRESTHSCYNAGLWCRLHSLVIDRKRLNPLQQAALITGL